MYCGGENCGGSGGGPTVCTERGRAHLGGAAAFICAVALAAIFALASCVTVHQGDPLTVAQLEETITAEQADFARFLEALKTAGAKAIDVAGVTARHEAELDRLGKLLAYERSKLGDAAAKPAVRP
jgi:hypothetical protein